MSRIRACLECSRRDPQSQALVEELRFQEDLAVSDGNDVVGGDVGRHVSMTGRV